MLRRLLGAAAAAGTIAITAVAPANAALEFCLVDPTVMVGGTPIEVGLYTPDANLAHRDLNGTINIAIIGHGSATITTDPAAWSQVHHTNLSIVTDGHGRHGGRESVDIVALVPATNAHEPYLLRVQLPDGSIKTAAGAANAVVQLHVDVPVRH